MTLKLCLAGATGHVGQELVKAILASGDLKLVSGVARKAAGQPLGADARVFPTVGEAIEAAPADVFIDYTHPDAVKGNLLTAIAAGCHAVVGTSGLSDADYAEIEAAALKRGVGVFAAGNFSVTAALLQHFALQAAKAMPHWEILDYASDTKPDAPSGTARELAYKLGQVTQPEWAVPVSDTKGLREARGATLNGSQLHSVRMPGYYSAVQAIFGDVGERIELRHESNSYAPYVTGTLLAVRKVSGWKGLKRGMAALMDFG